MHTKKNASFIITIALSMIILAYITFVTVYEQILSKSNGFFNVILFGAVLVLVFIFITLLARVITVNPGGMDNASVVLYALMAIGILAIFAAYVFLRLQYTTTVLPSESVAYKAAEYMSIDSLAAGAEIHEHIISYPADFIYPFIVSLIFRFTGASGAVYTIVNIAMMIVASIFLFETVNLISSKTCAAYAVIMFLFMPNNTFLVYSYNSELFVTANFCVALYLYVTLIYRRFVSAAVPVLLSVLLGIFSGLCISAEPVLIFAFIALSVWVIKADRQSPLCVALPNVLSICVLSGVSVLKSTVMNAKLSRIFGGILMCFNPIRSRDDAAGDFVFANSFRAFNSRFNDPSRFMNDNFYFLTGKSGKTFSANQAVWLDIADQLIYIFMLIMCVMCLVYILRVTYDKIMPLFSALIALFLGQLLGGINDVNYSYFFVVLVIAGAATLHYMYLNHHNDYAVYITNKEINHDSEIKRMAEGLEPEEEEVTVETLEEEMISDADLIRARALIFIGENEELYKSIKIKEKQDRLNNPYAATRIKTTVNEEGEYDSYEEGLEYFDEPDEIKEKAKPAASVTAIPATRPVEIVKPVIADEYLENTSEAVTHDAESERITHEAASFIDSANVNVAVPESDTDISNNTEIKERPIPAWKVPASDEFENAAPVQPKTFVGINASAMSSIENEVPDMINTSAQTEMPGGVNVSAKNDASGDMNSKPQSNVFMDINTPAKPEAPAVPEGFVFRNKNKSADSASAAAPDFKAAAPEAAPAAKSRFGKNKDDANAKKADRHPSDVKPGEPLPNPLPTPKKHEARDFDFDFDVSGGDDFDI